MKRYIISLLLVCSVQVYSQEKAQAIFVPPFDFPLSLSGNFGELRSNHFHGGLDFKSQGVSGKKVLSIGDGYIVRILVTHGSGYMYHVRHDNGYTAIYRHLMGFVSPIAERVEAYQYENETWEVSITPDSTEYRVLAGQHIAWGGNTGYSFGPHLHLDLFETESKDFIDPLPFFKHKITDTRPPAAQSIMLFPQPGKGVVNGSKDRQTFKVEGMRPIEAWGVIGAGIKAYDYTNGAPNRCGVHTVTLTVDDKVVFRSVVDRFSSYENRKINSWAYRSHMKSFIDPGNKLRMLQAFNDQRGLITIDEERDYKFKYELKDLYGNTSFCRFTVRGKPQPIEPPVYREKQYLVWDKVNYIYEPGLGLQLPKGTLYDNVVLNSSVQEEPGAVSFTYRLHDEPIPLHTRGELYIGVRHQPMVDSTKYYVARIEKNGKTSSLGGQYENGFVKTSVRELGTFTVKIDTVAPRLTAVNPQQWSRTGRIIFKADEKETDIRSYRGTIDGKYVPFGWNIMSNQIVYEVNPRKVKRGVKSKVELTVTDECGNEGKIEINVTL